MEPQIPTQTCKELRALFAEIVKPALLQDHPTVRYEFHCDDNMYNRTRMTVTLHYPLEKKL